MRKALVAATILLAGASAASASALPESELSLAGVALGDPESRVLSLLGQPMLRADTGEGIALSYPGMTVFLGWLTQRMGNDERRVIEIFATDSSACTPSRRCPGSSLEEVVATYGQPEEAVRENGSFVEIYSDDSSCWLQLAMVEGRVKSIRALCQP